MATAEVHADLAAEFGTAEIPPGATRDLADQMTSKLEWACAGVPELRPYASRLRGYYADLAEIGGPLPLQRVHGDYHLGQVLRTPTGWGVLDFEGEPVMPLAQRRAPAVLLLGAARLRPSGSLAVRQPAAASPGVAGLSRLSRPDGQHR